MSLPTHSLPAKSTSCSLVRMTAPIPGVEAADCSAPDHVLERLPRLGTDDVDTDRPLKSRCTVYK